jgi:DMSO reductase family type II enzyme heme b subunit
MEDAMRDRLKPFVFIGALALAGAAHAQAPLVAPRVPGAGPILDPDAAAWKQARPQKVALLPQMMAAPRHDKPAVAELTARALHNGQWLALRLEWKDASKSDRFVTDQFGDQVAVQFPVRFDPKQLPAPMMGNPGGRVNILHWRAAFQRDIEQGEPQVRDLYPHAVADLYPDQVLRATDARPYSGALGVDNPVSRPKASPVLDQMAEGWGTMTVKPDQHADGKGVWENGAWRVVITVPLVTESANSPRFEPGGQTLAAFAVWEGGNREVGSRKSWSAWVPLRLAK